MLLSAPGFELLGQAEPDRSLRLDPVGLLDALPEPVVVRAREWEGHVLEVETGLRPPATTPHLEFDPARTTLEQRDAAKAAELTAAGRPTSKGSVKRMRLRYRAEGTWGLVAHRYTRTPSPHGRVDERVVAATQVAVVGQTDRSTGTKARLWRQVQAAVDGEYGPGVVPLPSKRTFERLVDTLAMAHSRIPRTRLLALDTRLEQAAAKPVIAPETMVIDRARCSFPRRSCGPANGWGSPCSRRTRALPPIGRSSSERSPRSTPCSASTSPATPDHLPRTAEATSPSTLSGLAAAAGNVRRMGLGPVYRPAMPGLRFRPALTRSVHGRTVPDVDHDRLLGDPARRPVGVLNCDAATSVDADRSPSHRPKQRIWLDQQDAAWLSDLQDHVGFSETLILRNSGPLDRVNITRVC